MEELDLKEIKKEIKKMLLDEMLANKARPDMSEKNREKIGEYIDRILYRLARSKRINLSEDDTKRLREQLISEFTGYGILQPLLDDPTISDIMINGLKQICVERQGRLEQTNITFSDENEMADVIQKMLTESGKRLDRSSPYVDLRIQNGVRVTAVIPPISPLSPIALIRKRAKGTFSFKDLTEKGTITPKVLQFLKYCVISRLNILIAGGTGVGKTTLLNLIIKEFIPEYARLVIIEDTEEIVIDDTQHFIKLLTQPSNIEGKGEITLQDLVRLSLHLRPDRIIIGEVRGAEAFNLLQAINTGHEGSMCTIHANDCEDAINRLVLLSLMDNANIPDNVIRRMVASGLQLIIHSVRMPGGERKISQISELLSEGDRIIVKNIFNLKRITRENKEISELTHTGYVPSFAEHLKIMAGMPEDFFTK